MNVNCFIINDINFFTAGIKQNISLNSNQTSIPLSPLATFTSCIPMNDVISVQFMLSLNMNEIEFETGCDRNVKFDQEFSGLCGK